LIPNGDFASGTTAGWDPYDAVASISVVPASDADVPAGAPTPYVLKFDRPTAATVSVFSHAQHYSSTFTDGIAVQPGEQYRFRIMHARGPAADPTSVVFHRYYRLNDGTVTFASDSVTMDENAWGEYALTFTVPANAVLLRMRIRIPTFVGTAYFAQVSLSKITPGVLIEDGAITAAKINALAVTAGKIAANAVTTSTIAAGAVTATEIAANAVTTAKINALAVTATEIAAGAVTADKILAGSVTAIKIAAGAIESDKIAANAVVAATIATGAITTAKIAAGAVTATEIATGTITATQIAANAITAVKIAAGAIETAKIAAGAIDTTKIASGAVTTDKLNALAVTAGKIAANAVTATEIAANAITSAKISADAVTAGKIAAGAISTSSLFATGVVQAAAIASGAVIAEKVAAGAITAEKINVERLSAIHADAGQITAGHIRNAAGTYGLAIGNTQAEPEWLRYISFHDSDFFIKHEGLTLDHSGNAVFSGALSAATGTFSGALSAATGTFEGDLTAEEVEVSSGGSLVMRPEGTYGVAQIIWKSAGDASIASFRTMGDVFAGNRLVIATHDSGRYIDFQVSGSTGAQLRPVTTSGSTSLSLRANRGGTVSTYPVVVDGSGFLKLA
jgi:hypothetical protein